MPKKIKNPVITCESKIEKSFFDFKVNRLKPRNIGTTTIGGKEYILKKEISSTTTPELDFYEKNEKKIKKDKMDPFMQVPIMSKKCENNQILYLFHKLDGDVNRKFVNVLSKEDKINVFEQTILIIFYLNHTLKYYHNDLTSFREFYNFFRSNNIMHVKNNNPKLYLKVDKFKVKVGHYKSVVIDFGLASHKHGLALPLLYNSLEFFLKKPIRFKSEIFLFFLVYYAMYNREFNILLIQYCYNYFEEKTRGWEIKKKKTAQLIDFDRIIYKNFKNLIQ
jgi:hypothetical protein